VTEKLYVVLSVSPVTVIGEPAPEAFAPPGSAATV